MRIPEGRGSSTGDQSGGSSILRSALQWVRGLLADPPERKSEYRLVGVLFLRGLALIYLAAFVSIAEQIVGLAGEEGILPFAPVLEAAWEASGTEAVWRIPTLFWIDAGDTALRAVALGGCVFSVLLFCGVWPRVSAIALFVLYLSLFHAGQIFMNFQWDYLLLECGFLAILLPSGSRLVVWLYRWLLFRLRFLSGLSKLLAGDPSWTGLTALTYYFEVQPLPHPGAWYAHQLPEWSLRGATGGVLVVELLVPFMMFMARGPRLFAAWVTIVLQVLILATSNHNWFNLLTLVLCLFLFDDRALSRVVPSGLRERLIGRPPTRPWRGRTVFLAVLAGLMVGVSILQMWAMVGGRELPRSLDAAVRNLNGFHIVNRYHVFPTMRTERLELLLEGSRDGQEWRPYEFRYKPGDPALRPRFAIPHQPRLDWLMWFVPAGPPFLGVYEGLRQGLLENRPEVLELMAANPFPEGPPRFLRADLYRYHFTNPETRAETGRWWTREYVFPFFPRPSL